MNFIIVFASLMALFTLILCVANYSGDNFKNFFFSIHEKAPSGFSTALEFFDKVNKSEFDGRLTVGRTKGVLTDCFIPKTFTVLLSETTHSSCSSLAFAIVGHEMGHADQQSKNPKKILNFLKLKKASNKLAPFFVPLTFAATLSLLFLPQYLYVGIALSVLVIINFALCLIVAIMSVPIEKYASKKAIEFMRKHSEFEETELKLAKKLLSKALFSYISQILKIAFGWTGLVKKGIQ